MHVLLVEDSAEVRVLVARALGREGHRTTHASTVDEAYRRLSTDTFDLIVLDLGLPDGDGIALCRKLRSDGGTAPVLVLTARSSVPTRVAGLDAGADDFLAKPFAVAELRARVRALLRRGSVIRQAAFERDGARIDFASRRAWGNGIEVPLTHREWSLLELLTVRAGRVVSRAEILESLWGSDSSAAAASLEVIIGRVRKKLGGSLIRTVRGEGYVIE